jgi:anti-sigma factor RsiW
MNFQRRSIDEHSRVSGLIPWYVNGTAGEADRRRVEQHVRDCSRCRADLEQEQRVYEAMSADPGVEYMPAASLKKLTARLDELEVPTRAAPMPRGSVSPVGMPWRGLVAASIAAAVFAVSLAAADRWFGPLAANYHTVTASATRPSEEVIRAVFAPSTTLSELQSVLDEAQLRIVSGPTEAGVYSLASTSSRPVSASLRALRAHASVRFAESTR